MHLLFPVFVALIGLPAVFGVASLLFLLLAAAFGGRRSVSSAVSLPLSLAVIVPAHNEELVLSATLESLLAQTYPAERLQIVVVADNCTDQTADLARAYGVTVLERTDSENRGKGFALNHAVAHLLRTPAPPDGFVIIDADTCAAPDFFQHMSARLASVTDPNGLGAWQGRYGVLNAGDGWRAALMAGAFDLVNHVKPLGRERLGLSVGLKGNGMAFTRALAAALPWPGGSLTEDLDYGLAMAQRFGLRVGYAPEARVQAQMPATAGSAASQRARWEGGRSHLIRERALPLLWDGLHRRSLLLLDLAWDLLTPPLAELGLLLAVFAFLVLLGTACHWLPQPAIWLACALFGALGLPAYILGGLRVSDAPPAAYAALLRAPFYAIWKFALLLARAGRRRGERKTEEWVRTARSPLARPETPAALPRPANEVRPK